MSLSLLARPSRHDPKSSCLRQCSNCFTDIVLNTARCCIGAAHASSISVKQVKCSRSLRNSLAKACRRDSPRSITFLRGYPWVSERFRIALWRTMAMTRSHKMVQWSSEKTTRGCCRDIGGQARHDVSTPQPLYVRRCSTWNMVRRMCL